MSLSRHLLERDISNLLSLSTLQDLDSLRQQLEHKRYKLEERSQSLREQLEATYTRLDLEILQIKQLFHRHLTTKPSDIAGLEPELKVL